MGYEERVAARAAKAAEKAAEKAAARADGKEKPIWDALDQAVAAAAAGDSAAEERAIREGARLAVRGVGPVRRDLFGDPGTLGRVGRAYRRKVEQLTKEGKLRRGEYIGRVGGFEFTKDRIVAADGSVYAMDADVHASVETAGSLSVGRRPTLTRMAAGALLPGSALIPGFALAKKEIHDSRELYFILEHPQGGAVVAIDPNLGQVVREIAVRVNQAASELGRSTKARDNQDSGLNDVLAQLTQLGELRDAGVLNVEEFEEQKARILGKPSRE